MHKRTVRFIILMLVVAVAVSLPCHEATALQAGGVGTTGEDACTEKLYECMRACGPPGANPPCERYCQEEVFQKCKSTGAAIKGRPVTRSPGAVDLQRRQ